MLEISSQRSSPGEMFVQYWRLPPILIVNWGKKMLPVRQHFWAFGWSRNVENIPFEIFIMLMQQGPGKKTQQQINK